MNKAKQLAYYLMYQMPLEGIHTYGPCSTKDCPSYARGCHSCEWCVLRELQEAVGLELAANWKNHLCVGQELMRQFESLNEN